MCFTEKEVTDDVLTSSIPQLALLSPRKFLPCCVAELCAAEGMPWAAGCLSAVLCSDGRAVLVAGLQLGRKGGFSPGFKSIE